MSLVTHSFVGVSAPALQLTIAALLGACTVTTPQNDFGDGPAAPAGTGMSSDPSAGDTVGDEDADGGVNQSEDGLDGPDDDGPDDDGVDDDGLDDDGLDDDGLDDDAEDGPRTGECGDGTVDLGEDCDDQGRSETCNDDCTFSECGDGLVNDRSGEECDGAADPDNASCDESCRLACEPMFADCNDDFVSDGCETQLDLPQSCGQCGVNCGESECLEGACEGSATHGNDVEFDEVNLALANYLLGNRVTVPAAAMLTHLGVFSQQGGVQLRMALYTDVAGNPGTLVASTPATPTPVGQLEVALNPSVAIPAGDYWLLGLFSADGSIGLDTTDPTTEVRYIAHPFGNPLPDPMVGAIGYEGQALNYYVRVVQ